MVGHPGNTPEEALWRAVIIQAFRDISQDFDGLKATLSFKHIISHANGFILEGKSRKDARKKALGNAKQRRFRLNEILLQRHRAKIWFDNNDGDFKYVCQGAGLDPDVVRRKARYGMSHKSKETLRAVESS